MTIGTTGTTVSSFVARTGTMTTGTAMVLCGEEEGGTHVFGLLRREARYVRVVVWQCTMMGMCRWGWRSMERSRVHVCSVTRTGARRTGVRVVLIMRKFTTTLMATSSRRRRTLVMNIFC